MVTADLRVLIAPQGPFVSPDLTIYCGEPPVGRQPQRHASQSDSSIRSPRQIQRGVRPRPEACRLPKDPIPAGYVLISNPAAHRGLSAPTGRQVAIDGILRSGCRLPPGQRRLRLLAGRGLRRCCSRSRVTGSESPPLPASPAPRSRPPVPHTPDTPLRTRSRQSTPPSDAVTDRSTDRAARSAPPRPNNCRTDTDSAPRPVSRPDISSVSATPRSRGSHISSSEATVRNAFPRPVSPFCRSVGVYSAKPRQKRRWEMQPERGRVHLLLGHRQLPRPDVLPRIKLDLLEPDDLPVHPHVAMHALARSHHRRALEFTQRLHLRVIDRIGIVIAIHALHISLALFEIEALHMELFRLVQIDRLLMQSGQRGRIRYFADDLRLRP